MESLWQVLLHASANQQDPLSCDECFVLMDYLSDLLSNGHPPDQVLPLAEKYLERCPACPEKHQQAMAELVLPSGDDQETA